MAEEAGGGRCGAAALVAVFLLAGGATPAPAGAQELPDGVTQEAVDRGRSLFRGDGFCYNCHGRNGRGIPNLGSDLSDDAWIYLDGSLEGLMTVIRDGVAAEESTTGIPMPPMGGARLSPEQVRALAAYVWTLSRSGGGSGGAS